MSNRLANGVRARVDEKGDAWANEHRQALGSQFYLQDIDALFGTTVFGQNTAERLFLEYVPDSWANRTNRRRAFGVIALWDRKRTIEAARTATLSTAVYLHICRAVAHVQPVAPRFFWVIGDNAPPWGLQELSIDTGEELNALVELYPGDWARLWHKLGLSRLREDLSRWV